MRLWRVCRDCEGQKYRWVGDDDYQTFTSCPTCNGTGDIVPVVLDRERIAESAFNSWHDSEATGMTWDRSKRQDIWFAIADAVIALLGGEEGTDV